LPVACLHEIPPGTPDEVAVFTEPLAAALEIMEQTHIRPTDPVAIVGDGKLGLLCAQVLRLPGCEVVVVGRHPERWGLLHALCITPIHSDTVSQTDTMTRWQDDKMRVPDILSPPHHVILSSYD